MNLLAACCRWSLSGDAAIGAPVPSNGIDWQKTVDLAAYHRVRPQLLSGIRKSKELQPPASILKELERQCREIVLINLNNTREMIRLLRQLEQKGLEAVPFKGAYLAAEVYGDLGLRESTDIDFFFRLEQLPELRSVFAAEAYSDPYGKLSPEEKKRLFRNDCEYYFDQFEGENRLFHVEFHWRLGTLRHQINLDLDILKPFQTTGTINGFPIQIFSPEATLLVTAAHHGVKDYWYSLRHVCDIAFIAQRFPHLDWTLFLEIARKQGLMDICLTGIGMADALFELSIPSDIRQMLDHPKIQNLTAQRLNALDPDIGNEEWTPSRHIRNQLLYQLKARERVSDKLKIVYHSFRHFLAPNQRDKQNGNIPPRLHFLLYLSKPFRLLKEHFLNQK